MHDRTFHILTFGCQMNVNDSDWLARALMERGFTEAPLGQARVTIVNTCSVRDKPEQKVYSTLGSIRKATRHIPDAFVAVAGCVAQQVGRKFFSRFPHVRLVFGTDGAASAPQAIERLCSEPGLKLSLLDFSEEYPERDPALDSGPVAPSGFVNIMQGCDNFCAYCIVPYTRGRQKSRATEAILTECQGLIARGARELNLLGQNVNSFGQDKHGDGTTFAQLLHKVAALPGVERLRITVPHPKDIAPEVVEAFGTLPNLCPRLHLPLQAGSDRILKLMGRKYDMERFRDIVTRLRSARPDIALSTDLIVGFPGETEEDFEATLRAVQEFGFIGSYSFAYSDRPGTRAEMLPHKVDASVKGERLIRLQALQNEVTEHWLRGMIGAETNILLEGKSPKAGAEGEQWQGRDPYGNPVHINLPAGSPWLGRLLPVSIVEAKKHSLVARQRGIPW